MEYIRADEVEVFVCHSYPLKTFLTKSKGLRYIVVGLNPNSKDKFWAFVKCDRLQEALDEWRDTKPRGD